MAPAVERRVDPEDGAAYTFEELSVFYKGKYKKTAIEAYWAECKPVKGKQAKSSADPQPKAKAKAKAKVKAEPKPKGRTPAAPEDVLGRIRACTVIPVIKVDDAAHSAPLAKALKEGGIDVVEITFRTDCAAEAIRAACREVEGVCAGAGTVLTPKQVDEAIEAGADFIVSPGFDPAVARRCAQRKALYLPGVVTPTEVMMATSRFKLKALKFFPASNFGGAATLKSYAAVFPAISWMPTGGVTEANIGDFVSLPNVMAAGGSWMVADAAVKAAASSGNWSAIAEGARKASQAAHAGRNHK